jgi:hypothetical protein
MKTGLKMAAAALAGALTMGVIVAAPVLGETGSLLGSSAGSEQAHPWLARRAQQRGELRAAVAANLGIDADTLTEAIRTARTSVRDELGPLPDNPSDADIDARVDAVKQAVADDLGIDVATLEQAGKDAANTQLDNAVAAGRIDETRANEIRDSIANGTLRQKIRDRWHARSGD